MHAPNVPVVDGSGMRGSHSVDAQGTFVSAGFSSGSGFTANGIYNGDHWRVGFHVGSSAFNRPLCRPSGYPIGCGNPGYWPIYGGYPIWWADNYLSYYGNRYGDIYGFYSPPDPTVTNVVPAPPPTTEAVVPSTNRELADTYLRAGDARAAIKAYQAHLRQYPGDEEAMRALGLALIDGGQTTEGVAMIAMAYKAEPLLADRPINPETFRYGPDGLARNLSRVSIYANRVKTPSGWLTVAALMQAQGRDDLAKTMVERARVAGLETVVADRMISALR